MSLLLKALNKSESEEGKQPEGVQSAPVDFDDVESAPPSDKAVTPKAAGFESGGDVEEKRQRLVSATRVFGAKDNDAGTKKGGKAVVLLSSLLVIFGGGYFYLDNSGINIEDLVGIEWSEEEFVPKKAAESSRKIVAIEGSLLLPKPSIDVQSEVDFTAFQDIGTEELSDILDDTPDFDILDSIPVEDDGGQGVVSKKAETNDSKDDYAEVAVSDVVNAEENRKLKEELDSRTPSDSRLGGIVVKRLAAVQKLDDIVDENADATASKKEEAPEEESVQKIAEKDVVASVDGADRKRMLIRARDLYRNGSYAEAETVYKNILRDSPTSVDALRGMALLATATRRYQLAVATYLKILDFYPGDPFAVAGLTNLSGDSLDPYEVEKSLKNVLGKNQNLDGRIYFSLGNVYATQQRWGDAQDSYFKAFSHEPKNPDYAYNLAVTLDYLNKQKLALRYYEEAIRLAKHIKLSGFSVSAAKARVSILKNK